MQDFSATQILREINFGHFEALKTAILAFCTALNFEHLGIFKTFSSVKFFKKSSVFKMVKTAIFDLLKSAKIDFTWNQRGRKIAEFAQSKIPIRLSRSVLLIVFSIQIDSL